jgi:hypothetical protein
MTELGYGVESWCLGSLVTGRFVRGVQVVAQAIYRRLTTPRGTLRGGEEEENYGIDLSDYVGSSATPQRLAAIPGIVRAEVLKDDRVLDVKVSCTFATSADGLVTVTLALWVTLSETGEAFPMTLTAGEAGVQLSMGTQ